MKDVFKHFKSKGWVVTVYDESNEIYESPMNYPGHSTRGYLPGLKPASTYTTVVRNALTGDEVGLYNLFNI